MIARACLPAAIGVLFLAAPAMAQSDGRNWSATVYLQQTWPKQTETNRQIKEDINGSLGTHFQTWDDVANLNLGFLLYRDVAPTWKAGIEVDYSQGRIHGEEAVGHPLLGPGIVSFEQKYSVYADVLAMVQYRPFAAGSRWVPFLTAGVGFAYERDRTTLGFASQLVPGNQELLKVDNEGWFPMLTAGIGVDVYFSARREWFGEVGVSHSWARLKRDASASGVFAPGPTVKADTDSTGPSVWLGIGKRF